MPDIENYPQSSPAMTGAISTIPSLEEAADTLIQRIALGKSTSPAGTPLLLAFDVNISYCPITSGRIANIYSSILVSYSRQELVSHIVYTIDEMCYIFLSERFQRFRNSCRKTPDNAKELASLQNYIKLKSEQMRSFAVFLSDICKKIDDCIAFCDKDLCGRKLDHLLGVEFKVQLEEIKEEMLFVVASFKHYLDLKGPRNHSSSNYAISCNENRKFLEELDSGMKNVKRSIKEKLTDVLQPFFTSANENVAGNPEAADDLIMLEKTIDKFIHTIITEVSILNIFDNNFHLEIEYLYYVCAVKCNDVLSDFLQAVEAAKKEVEETSMKRIAIYIRQLMPTIFCLQTSLEEKLPSFKKFFLENIEKTYLSGVSYARITQDMIKLLNGAIKDPTNADSGGLHTVLAKRPILTFDFEAIKYANISGKQDVNLDFKAVYPSVPTPEIRINDWINFDKAQYSSLEKNPILSESALSSKIMRKGKQGDAIRSAYLEFLGSIFADNQFDSILLHELYFEIEIVPGPRFLEVYGNFAIAYFFFKIIKQVGTNEEKNALDYLDLKLSSPVMVFRGDSDQTPSRLTQTTNTVLSLFNKYLRF